MFAEAAKLMVFAIHNYSMSPSWIWRAAFHIFRCARRPAGLCIFSRNMNPFQMIDENNRILEAILSQMVIKNWEGAVAERPDKLSQKRMRNVDLSREPECLHVQRLQRLYEGLSYFALWHLNKDRPSGAQYLEKAKNRFSEVESLIDHGHICDVFIRPYVHILLHEDQASEALELLQKYATQQTNNPNTDYYLAEWYLHTAIGRSAFPENADEFREVLEEALPVSVDCEEMPPLLKHLVAFSLRLLPMPAAPNLVDADKSRHCIIADICCSRGFHEAALDIAFKLLDHPSWCRFRRPWLLLQTCISKIGISSEQVSRLWTLRTATWKLYVLSRPDLCDEGRSAKLLLKSVPRVESETVVPQPDEYGPILEVNCLRSFSETS
ncbi:unnamed protein product [Mesocestoides corti]|nr:unnamed protein product [Mesocestoides corti]